MLSMALHSVYEACDHCRKKLRNALTRVMTYDIYIDMISWLLFLWNVKVEYFFYFSQLCKCTLGWCQMQRMGTGWRMCNQPCLDDCQLCKWLSHVQKQRKLTGWRNENDARGGRNQAARRHHPTPYYSYSKYASIWFGHIFFHYYVNILKKCIEQQALS